MRGPSFDDNCHRQVVVTIDFLFKLLKGDCDVKAVQVRGYAGFDVENDFVFYL
jgi:hypothetical protein